MSSIELESEPIPRSDRYKYYVVGLASWVIFLCTFGAAGPAVLVPQLANDFYHPASPGAFAKAIAEASYFVTVCFLMLGLSNIAWVPLMVKYGRRPIYITSFALYMATAAWCACARSPSSMLAARALLGCAAGAGEVLGPLTIADIFFVHQRGRMMVYVRCADGVRADTNEHDVASTRVHLAQGRAWARSLRDLPPSMSPGELSFG